MEGGLSEVTSDTSPRQDTYSHDDDQSVYFVPYKWWKEAKDSCSVCDSEDKGGVSYTAVQASSLGGPLKIFNSMFYSDLMFNLNRDDCLQSNENGEVETSVRGYALVLGDMWLEALKWHSSQNAAKDGKNFSDDEISDVYPLQLRLSVLQEMKSLGVKISKKDNAVECFRRACKIFSSKIDSLRIWDFSGKTKAFLSNNKSKDTTDTQSQPENEILLELQIYGLSDFSRSWDAKKDERTGVLPNGKLSFMNGGTNSSSVREHPQVFSVGSVESGCLGLTGLQNLGNTCFMNSALQCLIHTPKLIDYFLGDYCGEINHINPLGMDGEIALAFGNLLQKLWAPGATAVAPRVFKSKLARFAPQFSGFNQQDSQELLSFLLDGLHEDLNRVKCKPYAEVKDGDGRPDEEVADEYWHNHLARNDSIIVDLCQGQYRSTLVCPVCQKVSVTFDPFMCLSLPLPSTTTRRMTLTVISTDGGTPSPFAVTVPKLGKFKDLIEGLTTACSLRVNEALLVAEIYNSRIIRYLGEPMDSLSLIRDDDQLVAYRLPKGAGNVRLVVFMHQHEEETYVAGKLTRSWKYFGIPLLASSELSNGSDVCNFYLQSLRAFGIPGEEFVNDYKIDKPAKNEVADTEDVSTPSLVGGANSGDGEQFDKDSGAQLEFHLTDEKGVVKNEITMNGLIEGIVLSERLNVLVRWPAIMFKRYESCLCNLLPPVFKSDFFAKRPQDSVTLYKCLEGFLKEEPLGPDDMWFCPSCKKHCQAFKKLDLWRLPEILVIHLKRFSYNRFLKNKLEIYVDFPIHDLDLSKYICYRNGQSSNRYMLYAISNHYGSMGGGHYTAFIRHGGDHWYDFDDSRVSAIAEDRIKTSAAYVLFYRRVEC